MYCSYKILIGEKKRNESSYECYIQVLIVLSCLGNVFNTIMI